ALKSTAADSQTAATRTETTTQSNSEKGTQFHVGDAFSSQRNRFSVDAVETKTRLGSGLFNEEAPAGSIYVAIRYSITNISDKPIGAFSQPSIALLDPNGTEYSNDVAATAAYASTVDIDQKVLSDLNPGITVRGASVFNVSANLFSL